VLYQHNNVEFSQLWGVRGKARLEGNGCSIDKRCNAVRGRPKADPQGVPVVSRSRVPALANGAAIAFALCLAAKHHRNAESVIIVLIEHWTQLK